LLDNSFAVAKQQPQQPEISSSMELDAGSWQHQPSKQVDVDVEKNNRLFF
jgi:hypothetical protein